MNNLSSDIINNEQKYREFIENKIANGEFGPEIEALANDYDKIHNKGKGTYYNNILEDNILDDFEINKKINLDSPIAKEYERINGKGSIGKLYEEAMIDDLGEKIIIGDSSEPQYFSMTPEELSAYDSYAKDNGLKTSNEIMDEKVLDDVKNGNVLRKEQINEPDDLTFHNRAKNYINRNGYENYENIVENDTKNIIRQASFSPNSFGEGLNLDIKNRLGTKDNNKRFKEIYQEIAKEKANSDINNEGVKVWIENYNEYAKENGLKLFEELVNETNEEKNISTTTQEVLSNDINNKETINKEKPVVDSEARINEIKEITEATTKHPIINENSPLIGKNATLNINDGRRFGMTQDWQNPEIEGVIKSYTYPINGPTREAANMPPSSSGLNTIDPEVLKNIEENTRNNKNVPENKSPEDIDVNEEEIDPEIYDTIMNAGNGDPDIVTVNGEEVDPEIYETIMNAGNGERGFRTLDTNRSIDLDDDGNAYIKFGEERIPLRRGENGFYMETGKDGRRVNLGFDDEVLGEFDALGAKFEAKEKIGPKPRSQRKSGQTSISGNSKKNIKNTEARENTFKHKAVNAKKAAKEALENSSPSLKRYLTKTGLFSLGFNLFNFKSTYDESRQEGNGVISSAARGGLDFALGEVLGVGGYLGVTIAKELPTYAVKGLEEGAKMIREKNSMKRHEAFAYSSFQDTQQLATMRQSGMEMAKMANYNLQQTLMGTEAKFLHR